MRLGLFFWGGGWGGVRWWWRFWEEGVQLIQTGLHRLRKLLDRILKRTQRGFRPSLMIDEEVRGWRCHAGLGGGRRGEGTTAYQAWRMRRVNGGGGVRSEGGSIQDSP